MSSSAVGFEELCTKPELIILIYKQLTFREQLRLAGTSKQLKCIFESFIYPGCFRVLHTIKMSKEKFLVSNEGDANCLVLTAPELEDFIKVYAEDVEEFSEDMSKMSHKFLSNMRHCDVSVQQFPNLIRLRYVSLMIQDEDILDIAAQCPKLEDLHLIHCYSKDDVWCAVQIGYDLNIDSLQKIKNLKNLTVAAEFSSRHIKFSLFHELLSKLKLESFKSNSYLIPDKNEITMSTDKEIFPLKDLQISTCFLPERWGNVFPLFLKHFESLTHLRISMGESITENVLRIIAKTCIHLETLHIENSGNSEPIRRYIVPPKVKEFIMYNCYELTYEHLRQLLTEFEIEKFSSSAVRFSGTLSDFQISPCIQALDVEDITTYKLRSAYENNIHLKELKWHEKLQEEDYDNYNEFMDPGPLETCINLDTLYVHIGHIPVDPIMLLKNLKKLTLPQSMPGLNWLYLTTLLKHESLRELYFRSWIDNDLRDEFLKTEEIPSEGFATNIKVLMVHFTHFKSGLDFWLDLFTKNPDMKLICSSFIINLEFLKQLIECNSFPKYLRAIDVWGFCLKCKDLRRNFQAAVATLAEADKMLSLNCEYFEKIGRIVLYRQN